LGGSLPHGLISDFLFSIRLALGCDPTGVDGKVAEPFFRSARCPSETPVGLRRVPLNSNEFFCIDSEKEFGYKSFHRLKSSKRG
jgi:hypothetical protein